jgi:hypothetical protein
VTSLAGGRAASQVPRFRLPFHQPQPVGASDTSSWLAALYQPQTARIPVVGDQDAVSAPIKRRARTAMTAASTSSTMALAGWSAAIAGELDRRYGKDVWTT